MRRKKKERKKKSTLDCRHKFVGGATHVVVLKTAYLLHAIFI